jgi:capsular exopolysaccharide synthesis family protein
MSKFFEALKQAEQDRALRGQGTPGAPPATGRMGPGRAQRQDSPRAPDAPVEFHGHVEEHLVSLLAPTSFEAEQYRSLRHMVEQLHRTADLSVLAVASPTVGDGKTTTVINLAGALSQAPDARVLVIDGDLRQPSLAAYLGLDDPDQPGLVAAILDPALSLKDVVRQRAPFNLDVLPAGNRPSVPYEVLKSPRLGELLAEARQQYDYIVLDTAPLVPFPDCRVIGKWVDGFVVVVNANRTPKKLLEEGLAIMDQAKVVGLVFNGDERSLSARYSHTYEPTTPGRRGGWWSRRARSLRASVAGGGRSFRRGRS